jgi:D-aminoacyl-tRNA deacylase
LSNWSEGESFFDIPVFKHMTIDNLYMITIKDKTIIHEDLDTQLHDELHIDPSQAICISRHRSKSGNPTLTTHPIGNFGDAAFGGKPRTVVPSSPHLMTHLLRTIYSNAKKENLYHQVCFEVTHHGPSMSIPTLFAEVGSNQKEWEKHVPAGIIAQSLLTTLSEHQREPEKMKTDPIVIGIGGGHYAPRFTDVTLEKKVSFGHMIPSYHINQGSIDDEILEHTIEMTPSFKGIYIHRKALKKSQVSYFKQWCEKKDIPVFSSNDFILRS